ncbi:alpha/beta fold hydrolase [Vogesella sp. LIG4]|uniref:alpha/beta fold hydrolase n=1 Tax=Vogesella sp. LIG4 TaxID=1192162 RepID=UPI00081FB825|nr:alpha/beta hydrolase [Vogesella sp. LIG4]SCK27630.1 Pimeloyl-ACP methyl ester carboxylesterase [Vogesella sp. LIG4]
MTTKQLASQRLAFEIDGVALDLAALHRPGDKAPILFLHGFGSSKEDYADMVRHAAFDGHPLIAYDAPGCGDSGCSDLTRVSIPLLLGTALRVLQHYRVDKFHLVGHSMGGLTALLLASQLPGRVISFCNIEGNIAPEDCFLSRQIVEHANPDVQAFFDDFIARTYQAPAWSSALYAANLRHKVRAGAVRGIFESMVALSDHGELMTRFLSLPCRKMFMYGEQNAGLSYLAHIRRHGVRLAEVPACGHFPMYANPPFMWRALADFIGA